MSIQIYSGIERRIDELCKEHAQRIVEKETLQYAPGSFAPVADQTAFFAFRKNAIEIKKRQLASVVYDEVMASATKQIRDLLKNPKL